MSASFFKYIYLHLAFHLSFCLLVFLSVCLLIIFFSVSLSVCLTVCRFLFNSVSLSLSLPLTQSLSLLPVSLSEFLSYILLLFEGRMCLRGPLSHQHELITDLVFVLSFHLSDVPHEWQLTKCKDIFS